MKSVLVDFLVGAGLKPTSIVSYNHLGNNDGMNLSAPQTFRSKEISKSNVVRALCIDIMVTWSAGLKWCRLGCNTMSCCTQLRMLCCGLGRHVSAILFPR